MYNFLIIYTYVGLIAEIQSTKFIRSTPSSLISWHNGSLFSKIKYKARSFPSEIKNDSNGGCRGITDCKIVKTEAQVGETSSDAAIWIKMLQNV